MKKMVEQIISGIRHTEYHVDDNISSVELIGVLWDRFFMAFRGTFRKLGMKRSGKILFLGKRVSFRGKKNIEVGNGVTIQDNCMINAVCKGGVKIGNTCTIGKNAIIDCTGVLEELGESLMIGDNVGISPNFTVFVRGNVVIGNDTIIGPGVTIVAENHVADSLELPIRKQGTKRKGVTIGDDCWIGAGVTILDGVTIGDKAIVAAGAVVNKNVESGMIVGGVPAKIIRKREQNKA